jgi:cell division protein ZapA (FtsZ GTPase activity inhibitor)
MSDTPLADIDRRLGRIESALLGNSRDGLIQLTARMDERMADLEDRIEDAEEQRSGLMTKVHTLGTSIALLGYALWDSKSRM